MRLIIILGLKLELCRNDHEKLMRNGRKNEWKKIKKYIFFLINKRINNGWDLKCEKNYKVNYKEEWKMYTYIYVYNNKR